MPEEVLENPQVEGALASAGGHDKIITTLYVDTPKVEQAQHETPETTSAKLPPIQGRFGHYILIGKPFQGGMGAVYRAFDEKLNRSVALKMLSSGAFATDHLVERFQREARAVAQLLHPHIVPIFEIGQHDACHYFTMPFISGGNLHQHRRRYACDQRKAVELVGKVAQGVHHAHLKGILHRDLKPANIMLDENGTPMVGDFGLAKILSDEMEATQTGAALGTPPYMAPEQTEGKSELAGPATDVWALGVILYELITGQRPFSGLEQSQMFREIREVDPARPRSVINGVDRQLETIILTCLQKDPRRRYRSAQALADDIERWLVGEPIIARPEGVFRRIWRTVRRHPRTSIAASLLLAAVASVRTVDYVNDPERLPWEIQLKLMRREPITLIGETGGPLWSRRRTGEVNAPTTSSPDEPFRLSSNGFSLVELLPAVPYEAFRLDAEVRHLGLIGNPNALHHVGIYVGHHVFKPNQDRAHWYYSLQFADDDSYRMFGDRLAHLGENQPLIRPHLTLNPFGTPMPLPGSHLPPFGYGLGRVELVSLLRRETEGAVVLDGTISATYCDLSHYYWLPPPGVESRPWRRIALEVRPTGVSAFWDDRPFGEVQLHEIRQDMAEAVARSFPAEQIPANLLSNGGMGLFINTSTASFRRVRIENLE